ncbi:DUF4190 domain-containing protein [Nocardia sp. NPDC050710]|uniref:DUF4190 domain-containing protein n=1 Tax=Nocardia sp. NPDC050710 TaxID=3157220 RepID=UPI0033F23265
MTNPGDSDEWWKQYGGQGVSPESGGQSSVPQYPTSEPSGYPSAPQYPEQSPPSQPQYQQPPSQPYPQQPAQQPYPQQPNYGYPPGYQPYGVPPAQGTNGMAIGALVASLLGFCTCLGSIVGIILGVIALNQLKQRPQDGRGMALAGIWVGALGIVGWILYIVLLLATSSTT